jgi:hypothetical protein
MIRTMITAATTQPEVRRCDVLGAACGVGVPAGAPGLACAPGLDGAGLLLVDAGDPAPGEVMREPGPLASNLLPNPLASIPRLAPPASDPPAGPGRSGGGGTGVRNSSGSRPDGALGGVE